MYTESSSCQFLSMAQNHILNVARISCSFLPMWIHKFVTLIWTILLNLEPGCQQRQLSRRTNPKLNKLYKSWQLRIMILINIDMYFKFLIELNDNPNLVNILRYDLYNSETIYLHLISFALISLQRAWALSERPFSLSTKVK